MASAAVLPRLAPGAQFVTGPCSTDIECETGCCGFKTGVCAGRIIAQTRDGGCGFGDARPGQGVGKQLVINVGCHMFTPLAQSSQTRLPTARARYRSSLSRKHLNRPTYPVALPSPKHVRRTQTATPPAVASRRAFAPARSSLKLVMADVASERTSPTRVA